MAKSVRLDTPEARARPSLKPRREPHWVQLGPGCAIGYRKPDNTRPGTWLAGEGLSTMSRLDWRRARNFSGSISLEDDGEARKTDRATRSLAKRTGVPVAQAPLSEPTKGRRVRTRRYGPFSQNRM
jgi:hypothetical protein